MDEPRPRVCVVTAGHLSTCPRMLKAADALAGAGYRVRVVSARFMDWATAADREVRRTRSWAWTEVDRDRASALPAWLWSGARCRAAGVAVRAFAPPATPLWLATRAYSRAHGELLRAALAAPADLYYGGTTGGLAPTAAAARRAGVPYALDLEDFHSGESGGSPAGRRTDALAEHLERALLPGAAFLTAGSAAIAAAYREKYGVAPVAVHNTFPLPAAPPSLAAPPGHGLRLYWFSQTIGCGRGLEDAVAAMGRAELGGELHLRGRPDGDVLDALRRLAAATAPGLAIVHHPPAAPDRMVELCAGYDVGLALEQPVTESRRLGLTNKGLTYVLAGLPVALTDLPGQRELARDLGEGALVCAPGDVAALAAGLRRWAGDPAALARARAAAWETARTRWHWEHPRERGALLAAVAEAVG
jgi:hypothetical protein